MGLKTFDGLKARVAALSPVRLVVAGGNDPGVLQSVVRAIEVGMVETAIISGDPVEMASLVPDHVASRITLTGATSVADCATIAVAAVRDGHADILMKGHVDSTSYLRAVVNRDTGIRGDGVLSNVTVAAMASYPKLLVATDNGIIPAPNLEQKRQIILNTRDLFTGLGVDTIKVAAVAATEKVSDALPATTDARRLADESTGGNLPGFVVDGPFGYDVAVSAEAARKKGLGSSAVAGDADLILFPSIEAANAVAKSWKLHGDAETGSIVLGAQVPILLNSRSDGVARRLNALALAIVASNQAVGELLKG